MAKQALKIFIENQEKQIITYVIDTFEEAAFRFVPIKDSYQVFIKWKGTEEQSIDSTTKIVMESLLGGDVTTKDVYETY